MQYNVLHYIGLLVRRQGASVLLQAHGAHGGQRALEGVDAALDL